MNTKKEIEQRISELKRSREQLYQKVVNSIASASFYEACQEYNLVQSKLHNERIKLNNVTHHRPPHGYGNDINYKMIA